MRTVSGEDRQTQRRCRGEAVSCTAVLLSLSIPRRDRRASLCGAPSCLGVGAPLPSCFLAARGAQGSEGAQRGGGGGGAAQALGFGRVLSAARPVDSAAAPSLSDVTQTLTERNAGRERKRKEEEEESLYLSLERARLCSRGRAEAPPTVAAVPRRGREISAANSLERFVFENPMLILHVRLQVVLAREAPRTHGALEGLLARVRVHVPAPFGLVQEQLGTERTRVIGVSSPGAVFERGLFSGAPPAPGLGTAHGERVLVFPPSNPHHHLHSGLQLAVL